MGCARTGILLLLAAAWLGGVGPVLAYRAEGHEIIAEIAQEMIKGTRAEEKVKELLGGRSIAEVSTWADEINRGSSPDEGLNAWRDANQQVPPGQNSARLKLHHYTNVPIQESAYAEESVGTNPDDLVHAMRDCILILQGGEPSASFRGTSPEVALVLLIHYVGDFAQPLHVGAGFLDEGMKWVNPDEQKAESTVGGNLLKWGTTNLHFYWDDAVVRGAMRAAGYKDQPLVYGRYLAKDALAGKQSPPPGGVESWPKALVDRMMPGARKAYEGVTIVRREGPGWVIEEPSAEYHEMAVKMTQENLEAGGVLLGQILLAVWP